MKIILVIDRVMTGGAERILVDYYHYLERNGHEPYVFALSGKIGQSKWTDGLRITYGAPGDEANLIKKAVQQISLFFKLNRFVRKIKPDGMFSFLEKSNLLTIVVPTSKIKKVVSVHNVLSIQYQKICNKWVRKILYRMIQMAYNHCSHVVVVSKQVKDDLVNNFGVKCDNISLINNFVNRDFILEKTKDYIDNFIFDPEKKYILNVGRFSIQKAQWKLIKAFSMYLKKAKVDVELILMGTGDFTEKLVELAKKLEISSKVHILPFNTNPYKYMARAHLFALSSIYEGFPIVLAEVSSLRIPFIGSKKAVPEEMFDNKEFLAECIFDSSMSVPDFSSVVYEEERQLAQLLQKGIEDDVFRKSVLRYTQKWEDQNNKINQFLQYDKLIGLYY